MNLEQGKVYKLRNGNPLEVLYIGHHLINEPVIGVERKPEGAEEVHSFLLDGRYMQGKETNYDIVDEWEKSVHYRAASNEELDSRENQYKGVCPGNISQIFEQARRANALVDLLKSNHDQTILAAVAHYQGEDG